jgi:hypothetical protein
MMSAVFECETMDSNQKLIALALADHCHDDGSEARPGMARLKRKTALSERTIQRTLKTLVDDGFMAIQRKATPISPHVYQFTMGGATQTGGVRIAGGGCQADARGVSESHPNHKEPSLKQEKSSISIPLDMAAIRARRQKIMPSLLDRATDTR